MIAGLKEMTSGEIFIGGELVTICHLRTPVGISESI
jgi:ABC-type sugar transport system ATPase subunit